MIGALPDKMMAARLVAFGGPENMHYVEVDTPQPASGEVVVRIHASTINGFEIRFRSGAIRPMPGAPPWQLPFQFGREGAGEIVALGEGSSKWKLGDRVVFSTWPTCGRCAFCRRGEPHLCTEVRGIGFGRPGTQAEYVTVPEGDLFAAPEGAPMIELGSAVHNFTTVWHAIFSVGQLQAGQDILITGAGGGIGSSAIVVAKFAGARRIIAVTGDSSKADGLMALGATHIVNWRDKDVPAEVRAITGVGVDVALDAVGGKTLFELALQSVRFGGTVIAAAEQAGAVFELDAGLIIRKHAKILGSRGSDRHEQETVLSLVANRSIKPVINRVMPFSDIQEAHRMLDASQGIGKIVLVPD